MRCRSCRWDVTASDALWDSFAQKRGTEKRLVAKKGAKSPEKSGKRDYCTACAKGVGVVPQMSFSCGFLSAFPPGLRETALACAFFLLVAVFAMFFDVYVLKLRTSRSFLDTMCLERALLRVLVAEKCRRSVGVSRLRRIFERFYSFDDLSAFSSVFPSGVSLLPDVFLRVGWGFLRRHFVVLRRLYGYCCFAMLFGVLTPVAEMAVGVLGAVLLGIPQLFGKVRW
jgi:hypothetical protein